MKAKVASSFVRALFLVLACFASFALGSGGAGGPGSLSVTLGIGNTTSGKNIVVSTGDILSAASGTAAAPTYTFTGNTNYGWFLNGTPALACTTAGVQRWNIDGNGVLNQVTGGVSLAIQLATASQMGWSAKALLTSPNDEQLLINNNAITDKGTLLAKGGITVQSGAVFGLSSSATDATIAADTGLSRDAAGVIDFGTGAAASTAGSWKATNGNIVSGGSLTFRGATAQADGIVFGTGGTYSATAPLLLGPSDAGSFISAGSAASGTAGRALTLTSGPATGTDIASGGWLAVLGQATGAGACGNFDVQTSFKKATGASAQTLGDRLMVVGKQTALSTTNATTTTFVQLQLPTSNSSGGCTVFYTVEANDGTNWDTASGFYIVAASNKAGVVTATASAATEASNANSGTLADASAVTITGTNVNLRVTPAWTVIVPTTVQISYTIVAFGNGVLVAPQ